MFTFFSIVFCLFITSGIDDCLCSNSDDTVRVGPPHNVTIIISDTEVIIQWQEPNITETELFANPDNITYPTVGLFMPTVQHVLTGFRERLRALDASRRKVVNRFKDFFLPVFTHILHTSTQTVPHAVVIPRDQQYVRRYQIWIRNIDSIAESPVSYETPGDLLELRVNNLTRSTNYNVSIIAALGEKVYVRSIPVTFTTSKSHGFERNNSKCTCNKIGSLSEACDVRSHPPCKCKPRYTGIFCEYCRHDYYRVGPHTPCHKCPCNPKHSTGACYFEGYKKLRCLNCTVGYVGKLCERCARNYFPQYNNCVKCNCNNHSAPGSSVMCSKITGVCFRCLHNTTGPHCDYCLDGYRLDKVSGHCFLDKDLPYTFLHAKTSPNVLPDELSKGAIAAIVIVLILVLVIIVGFIVYRRYKRPVQRQFWTVEVRGKPEGTSMDDDESGKQLEDLSFRKPSRKDYSPLHEEL